MILSVEDLVVPCATSGDQLLGGSLRMDAGGVAGVIGHRDGGATALLDAITGRVSPQSGHIHWHGSIDLKLPWSMRVRGEASADGPLRLERFRPDEILRLGVVRVTTPCNLFTNLSVRDNLLLGASHRTLRPAIHSDLDDLLDLMPELKGKRSIHQLNTLQRTLLAIARAVMSQPRLLLLQDPLRGLDRPGRDRIEQVLARVNGQGAALLICAPSLDDMPIYPERIYELQQSRLTLPRRSPRKPRSPVAVFG